MQHRPIHREVTFGELVAVVFDQAESHDAEHAAELVTTIVERNLVRSPGNAAARRLVRHASRDWQAS